MRFNYKSGLKVIKDSTTPKQTIGLSFFIFGLKVIKDSTTPKRSETGTNCN